MAIGRPDEYVHNNPNRAIVDAKNGRGGLHNVADKAARNAIPEDKRGLYMIVSYSGMTEKFVGANVTDPIWTDDNNWTPLGGGTGILGLGQWTFNPANQTPPPATAEIITDNATIASSTKVYINETDLDGINKGNLLNYVMEVGAQLYFQQADDKANYFLVTVASFIDQGAYLEIDISGIQVEGTIGNQTFVVYVLGDTESPDKDNLRIVETTTERDNIPVDERKENQLVNVKTPYSWYQLIGGVDNANWTPVDISLISIGADIDIYISDTGNDTTGDGTVGNPFLTYNRAIDAIPGKNGAITITFYTTTGTFTWTDAETFKLSQKSFAGTRIEFKGTMITVEPAISFTENVNKQMEYVGNKAGVTLVSNQWRGYYVSDGDGRKYYPIAYNGGGSDTFDITYLRGNRGGTRDVARIGTTMDLSGSETRVLVFNFPGLSSVLFTKQIFFHPDEISFEYLTVPYEFDFACTFDCEQVLAGGFNNMSLSVLNFVGSILDVTDTVRPAFEQRDNMGQFSFVRTMIKNSNGTSGLYPVVEVQKQSHHKIRECAIIGSTVNKGISGLSGGIASLSKTNIFIDVFAAIYNRFGNWQVQEDYSSSHVYNLLRNVPYLIDNSNGAINFQTDIFSYDADGAFINVLYNTNEYINPKTGLRMNIAGTFPEIEGVKEATIANGASATDVLVGNRLANSFVRIEYEATRGSIVETGEIEITNVLDSLIFRIGRLGDVGLNIAKFILGDDMNLRFSDVLTDGNATTFRYTVTRKMV